MSRKILLVGLLPVLCVSAAPAGEIRLQEWPCIPVPQEIVAIPVLMDIGFWVEVLNQDAVIKLKQVAIHTYEGCVDLHIRSNTHLRLSCTIDANGKIPGTYSCSVTNADLNAPGGVATVCAKLTEANLAGCPGGITNLRVATVTVKVIPRAL